MNFLLITGMSGAGKSNAANALEDIGYYCVDNIPPAIIPPLVTLSQAGSTQLRNIAIVTDIRGGDHFKDVYRVLKELEAQNISYKILFLDAADDVIIKRYKENRRKHPLCSMENISVSQAVKKERKILEPLRSISDYVIDTSQISSQQLKNQISQIFLENSNDKMNIQCLSFGFKYGIATDADLVFDVRCLPNPFYDENLRSHTGVEKCVQDFVMNSDDSKEYLRKIVDLIDFLLPLYKNEGKTQLTIAFGCTGGKHRSVTFAELVSNYLKGQDLPAAAIHRDILKN